MYQSQKIKSILFLLALFILSCNTPDKKKETVITGQIQATPQNSLQKSMERGGLLYTDFCMQCHLGNGKGIPNNFPPLAGSNWLTEKRTESIHAVKFGQSGEIEVNGVTYNGLMAPMGLSDEEVADVLNYVMNSWGNKQEKMVTPEEVGAISK